MVEMKSQKACTHKFKYKTALCKNFESFGCCQYGDQCNYAHGFAELRGKTLGERQVCGMVGGDVMTFRTRPCFDHVSTGSCPFGSKCNDIHDFRLNGSAQSWLKCVQHDFDKSHDGSDSGFYIDGSRDTKIAQVHHNEPFGCKTDTMMSSYDSFKAEVSNSSSENKKSTLHNFHRVQMAQIMSNAIPFPFCNPSHIVCGRVCIILQEKTFFVPHETTRSLLVTEIVNGAQLNKFAEVQASGFGSLVTAREIAFGAPGSVAAEEQPAIWFNIPEDSIQVGVDMSTIKKQTKWLRDNPGCIPFRELVRAPSWDPFYVYFSERDDTRQLIKSILKLRFLELLDTIKGQRLRDYFQENKLQALFDSIKGDHLRWHWPVNHGREFNDPNAPTPPVDGLYCIPTRTGREVRKIWSSFHKNRFVMTNIDGDRTDEDHEEGLKQDESQSLNVFTTLALGRRIGGISPPMDVIIPPMISKQPGTLLPEGFEEAWSTHRKGVSTNEQWFIG